MQKPYTLFTSFYGVIIHETYYLIFFETFVISSRPCHDVRHLRLFSPGWQRFGQYELSGQLEDCGDWK